MDSLSSQFWHVLCDLVFNGTPNWNYSETAQEEAIMFRLILVLFLVGLVALAFYLGWVQISTNNSQDQSDITLSINKAKVNESVGALRGKIEGKSEKPEGKSEKPRGIKETTVS